MTELVGDRCYFHQKNVSYVLECQEVDKPRGNSQSVKSIRYVLSDVRFYPALMNMSEMDPRHLNSLTAPVGMVSLKDLVWRKLARLKYHGIHVSVLFCNDDSSGFKSLERCSVHIYGEERYNENTVSFNTLDNKQISFKLLLHIIFSFRMPPLVTVQLINHRLRAVFIDLVTSMCPRIRFFYVHRSCFGCFKGVTLYLFTWHTGWGMGDYTLSSVEQMTVDIYRTRLAVRPPPLFKLSVSAFLNVFDFREEFFVLVGWFEDHWRVIRRPYAKGYLDVSGALLYAEGYFESLSCVVGFLFAKYVRHFDVIVRIRAPMLFECLARYLSSETESTCVLNNNYLVTQRHVSGNGKVRRRMPLTSKPAARIVIVNECNSSSVTPIVKKYLLEVALPKVIGERRRKRPIC